MKKNDFEKRVDYLRNLLDQNEISTLRRKVKIIKENDRIHPVAFIKKTNGTVEENTDK